jgi:hypothetical protein
MKASPVRLVIGLLAVAVLFSVVATVLWLWMLRRGTTIPTGTTTTAAPAPLAFFVRPELDGLRLRNDGYTQWSFCRAEIDGHVAEVYGLTPGNGRTVSYVEFRGLEPDEGFTRARRRVRLTCYDDKDAASTATYKLRD